jgi:amidase
MQDVAFAPANRIATLIRRREIGCLEILDHMITRVERLDSRINAVVVRDFERARKRARALDRQRDDRGRLHGVPMTVKESFDIAGLPTTWGVPAQQNSVAEQDALAVRRLRAAGAVVFGKTNVPLLLADWQSYNDIYGTTSNPWNAKLTPGGSSGGSAAALAAGLTSLEVGSDIGSSIRNPAHFCGVYGHKPTWGICPPLGHALAGNVAMADLSVIGPLARSAEDLSIALGVIAGPEEIDAGLRLALPVPRFRTLKQVRVAILAEHPSCEVDASITEKFHALAGFLRRQGARVSLTASPEFDLADAHRMYVRMLRATTSARTPPEMVERFKKQAARLAHDDQSYYALMLRGVGMTHREWLAENEQRQRLCRIWEEFFKHWDVLLCPVAASAAWPHDHKGERWARTIMVNGHPVPTTDQMFWAGLASLTLLPSTAAPLGFTEDRLPIGMQIIGPRYADRSTIQVARLLEREWQDYQPPEGFE